MAGPGTRKQDWRPEKKRSLWGLRLAIDDRPPVEVADIPAAAQMLFGALVEAAVPEPGLPTPLVTVEEDAHDSWVRIGLPRRVLNATLYWIDLQASRVIPADREQHRRLEAGLKRLIWGR